MGFTQHVIRVASRLPSASLTRTNFILSSSKIVSTRVHNLVNHMATDTNAHLYQTHPILVWVDCEMTGLQIEKDTLMEIAVVLTDSDLNEVDTLGPLFIHTSQQCLDAMGEWCKKNHKKTGLINECLKSDLKIEQADQMLYDFLCKHQITRAGLAGNSVSYDRQFLAKYCPRFSSLFHYRNVDVSSFKEIFRRWYPKEKAFSKKLVHRALEDIRESILEMKYYRSVYFKSPEEVAGRQVSASEK